MRVLVCGGRNFADAKYIAAKLDALDAFYNITEVIHGDARGADRMAAHWGFLRETKVRAFPADWEKYPKAAGPIRNEQMLREGKPEMVIAFSGGRGTAHMIRIAKKAGIGVIQFG
jgi:hypothetical protein